MTHVAASNFRVITQDDYGASVRCSFCARGPLPVVVLPLTPKPELDERLAASDGEELWIGICANCVRAMAGALALVQNDDEPS